MATAISPPLGLSSRPTHSCVRCADRKVKCDRQRPCSACVKHNADCVFVPLRPPRKRHRRVEILNDRLKHYEALLQEQGIDTTKLSDAVETEPSRRSGHTFTTNPEETQLQTPVSVQSEPSQSVHKTQVVHGQGRSKFVENGLWTRVVEEFHNPEEALDDSSTDTSDLEAFPVDDFNFVLSTRFKSKKSSRHPPSEHIHQLWQVFTERIDPLTKIVHVPTLRPAIQKAAINTTTIPRSFEALMFAIYSAAVMSLKDEECKQKFAEPRKTLLARYTAATKAALLRAKFMGTTSLVVLQALVLHLLSIRDIYEPRAVWSLTGVAVRIAQSMGLDRDGDTLGLPPFEAELRRRVWWLLKTHDFRCAELCGLAKFRDLDTSEESTKSPTNVDDKQLYPDMISPPSESRKVGDMVFIAVRHEFVNFAAARIAKFRQQGKTSSQWSLHATGKDKAEIEQASKEIQVKTVEIEEILETKYLRYCDPSQPLHLFTMLMARSAVNNINFLQHHPRRWASIEQAPLSEREWIWDISIKLLEIHNMGSSTPQLRPFAWHTAYFLVWHVFIHVLDTLRANSPEVDAEKAWQVIADTYKNNPDMIEDTRKPIHVAVGNLCLKAYSVREASLQDRTVMVPETPEFILQLRQQREAARARRQARNARSNRPMNRSNEDHVMNRDMNATFDTGIIPSGSTHLQPSEVSQLLGSIQIGDAAEVDPFWFDNGFDDSQTNNMYDVMDMDADLMLAQDYTVGDNSGQTVSWEQWDAWLATSNILPPLSSSWDLH